MRNYLKNIINKMGFQIKKFPDRDYIRRMKIVNFNEIDTLFDIGANIGKYAINMRKYGYSNRIISFEPLESAYSELKKNSTNDKNWLIENYALGSENAKGVINVSLKSDTSSILNMLPEQLIHAPSSRYIGQQEIEIKSLDSVYNSFCNHESKSKVMIKIDTQGYEKQVLEGAKNSLKQIRIIQLEMSFIPLYQNETLFFDMVDYLSNQGFLLYSLENGFSNPITGQLLQVDGIFVNGNLLTIK